MAFGGRVVRAPRAAARQDVDGRARRPRRVRGPGDAVPGGALPFAGGRRRGAVRRRSKSPRAPRPDGIIMGLRHRELAGARRAVPPRVGADRRRPAIVAELPELRSAVATVTGEAGVSPATCRAHEAAAPADPSRGPHGRASRRGDGLVMMRRRGDAGANGRPARRSGDEGRAPGGDRRAGPDDAGARGDVVGRPGRGLRHVRDRRRSRPAPSTSRRRPRWSWRRAASVSPSTATDPCRAGAAAPTCSRRWASSITAPPPVVERSLATAGVAFLFAPTFHPAMKHAAPHAEGTGPAHGLQPAWPAHQPGRPARQIVGVPRPELTELVARALLHAGLRARVGRARRRWPRRDLDDGLHEGLRGARRHGAHLPRAPGDFGLKKGDAGVSWRRRRAHQRARFVEMLGGQPGPARDIVLLNAGAGLFVAGRAASVREGIATGGRGRRRRQRPPRARGPGAA